jgi:hypothetical protein
MDDIVCKTLNFLYNMQEYCAQKFRKKENQPQLTRINMNFSSHSSLSKIPRIQSIIMPKDD